MKKIIQTLYINDKKSDGSPYIDKNGNPYKMVNITFQGDPNKYSMFLGKYGQKDLETIQTWQAGMEVDVILEQQGQYWNFKLPSQTDKLNERINQLENLLRQICVLNGLKTKSGTMTQIEPESLLERQIEANNEEIRPEDIPF